MQDACPPAGRKIACPVLVAPMAMQRLAHPDGELATSRAAAAEGIDAARKPTLSFSSGGKQLQQGTLNKPTRLPAGLFLGVMTSGKCSAMPFAL